MEVQYIDPVVPTVDNITRIIKDTQGMSMSCKGL